jgi:hypothetical protein
LPEQGLRPDFRNAARRLPIDGLFIQEAFRDGGDAVALHGLSDVFHIGGALDLTLVSEANG